MALRVPNPNHQTVLETQSIYFFKKLKATKLIYVVLEAFKI